MREVKFRAWDKERGEFLSAGKVLISIHRGRNPVNHIWLDVLEHPDHWKDRFILMRYIGLKDKNGVEIYEGDIINHSWWEPGYVYWNQGECGPCNGGSCGSYIQARSLTEPTKGATYNLFNGPDVEVIGNIYENPELLEEKA